jgi:hypothetical protein
MSSATYIISDLLQHLGSKISDVQRKIHFLERKCIIDSGDDFQIKNTLYVDTIEPYSSETLSIGCNSDSLTTVNIGCAENVEEINVGTGTASNIITIGNSTDIIKIYGQLMIDTDFFDVDRTTGNTNIDGTLTVGGNVTCLSNLLVNGTTTTVESEIVTIKDNVIVVNSPPAGAGNAGGVAVHRYQEAEDYTTTPIGDVVQDTAFASGTASSGTTTTIILPSGFSSTDDYYNSWWIRITSGTGEKQVRQISDYTGSSKTATVATEWTTAPDDTSVFSLYNKGYVLSVYDETLDQWIIASGVTNPPTGELTITDYLDLHLGSLYIEDDLHIYGSIHITGNLHVDGITYLDKTYIDTTDGEFNVVGTNGITFNPDSAILINSTASTIGIGTTDVSQNISVGTGGVRTITMGSAGDGQVSIANTKQTTSKTDGSLIVAGDVGIAGDIYSASIHTDAATGVYIGDVHLTQSGSATDLDLNDANIIDGTMNNVAIGGTTPSSGKFTIVDVDNVRIDGSVITTSEEDGELYLTHNGDGYVNIDKVNIDSGTIDGCTIATSNITVGTGKTLDVSAGTLTLADDQISGDKIEGGTIGSITLTYATVNGGTINNTSIGGTTPSTGKFTSLVLYSSGNKLTLSGNQITTAGTNEDISIVPNGTGTISMSKATISALTGAMNCDSKAMTNVNIDSGYIDGTIIGSSSASAGTFTTMTGHTLNINQDYATTTGLINIGAGNDLKIYHNGIDSYIYNGTGDLYIMTDGSGSSIIFDSESDTFTFKFSGTTAATLNSSGFNIVSGDYMVDGETMISTTTLSSTVLYSSLTSVGTLSSGSISSGFGSINVGSDSISGGSITCSNLTINGDYDSSENYDGLLALGANDDLLMYHDGSNSYITNLTGNLTINTNGLNGGIIYLDSEEDGTMFKCSGTEVVQIDANGVNVVRFTDNYRINEDIVLTATTLGVGVLSSSLTSVGTLTSLKTSGTIELQTTTSPTYGANKGFIYAKDETVDHTEVYVMDEQGNETKISPHNDDGDWEFYSKNIKTGAIVRINMMNLIRKVEELSGEQFVFDE